MLYYKKQRINSDWESWTVNGRRIHKLIKCLSILDSSLQNVVCMNQLYS